MDSCFLSENSEYPLRHNVSDPGRQLGETVAFGSDRSDPLP